MSLLTQAEQAILETAAQAPMLEQVELWAATNSGTGNLTGLRTVSNLLADAFSALPGEVTLVAPDPVENVSPDGAVRMIERGKHLHARVRPEAPVQLLLTGHMDTVFAADHPFQTLKWLDDGVLNGPGTADMKGGLAVILSALRALEASPLAARIGYDVLINSDEETGSQASARLIAELAKGKVAALTYEPALPDGTLAGARPGSGNFSIVVHGRAAHAGLEPEKGVNSLVAAAELITHIATFGDPATATTVTPTVASAGTVDNVVPAEARVRVDVRVEQAGEKERIEGLFGSLATSVPGATIEVLGGINRPSMPASASAALFPVAVAAAAAAGLGELRGVAVGGGSDGNFTAARGVPTLDGLGAVGGGAHADHEYVLVDTLVDRARLLAALIERL